MFKSVSNILQNKTSGPLAEIGVVKRAFPRLNYNDNDKLNNIKKQATSTKKFFNLLPTVTDDGSRGYIDFNPCQEFLKDGYEYIMSFPEKQRRVVYCLIDLMHCKEIKVSNQYLADKCRVSLRTVQNATARLEADRIIIKEQSHQRSVNRYIFAPKFKKGKQSFQIWLNRLTPEQQGDYMMHNILPNGHQEKSHKYRICTLNINTREREYIYKNTVRGRGPFAKKKGKSMQWSSIQDSIAKKFVLGEQDKLKLVAFPDSCLEEVMNNWSVLILKRDYGRFIDQCKAWLQERGMKPDYVKYKRTLESLKASSSYQRSNSPDNKISTTLRNNTSPDSPYTPYKEKTVIETFEVKARRLKDELDKYDKLIEDPPDSAKIVGIEFMVKIYTEQKLRIVDELRDHLNSL